ncbi:Ig-like domain-containing protein [uncultured Flavonifractor sp.]|uniref:Ig-like domain-containing protein n=1 Tax=uncultured Flavonifractor sp. TaxID=1193534 RepID=UPI00262DC5EE|nr:Ig-like domain-containing protein [uncultured Flavonifractor sp.]
MKTRILTAAALAAALLTAALPASALFLDQEETSPTVLDVVKNGMATETIAFQSSDFVVEGEGALDAIVITRLPEEGVLTVGGQMVGAGDVIAMTAVDGLRFTPSVTPTALETSFTFQPLFADGEPGQEAGVELHLLTEANGAPVAENLELSTYKNVAVTDRFSAVDPEGDLLTYRLVKKPARGAVTIGEDGQFVYTPYENKTGKDSFTYIAMDTVGNASDPATVKVKIEKPDTKVTYADLSGHPAHKAAIRLAEEGIFVGECMGGEYFFQPDVAVTRSEFVAMAMNAAGVASLDGVSRTGFADDESIPTWAKPYVSSALKCGLVQGITDDEGRVVFRADDSITTAEAAVLLDRVLSVTDVDAQTFAADAPAWAAQSAANLSTCGVLPAEAGLTDTLTRGEAAQLLCAALDLLDSRDTGWF